MIKIKQIVYTTALGFIFFIRCLSPVLDGRVTPIILNSTYTFTNFEWARGFVVFNKGFSVPATRTALLDVYSPIEGSMNLSNGGTIIMKGPLRLGQAGFSNYGYIKTNNYEILYTVRNYSMSLVSPIHFFDDDVTINCNNLGGVGAGTLYGALNVRQIKNFTFKNGQLYFRFPEIRMFFTPNGLDSFHFHNTEISIFSGGIFTINAKKVNISGSCTFVGRGSQIVIPSTLILENNATFDLGESTKTNINQLDSGTRTSRMSLGGESSLIFTSTLSTTITGSGSFLISGKSSFIGQNTTVTLNPLSRIMISPGSRLLLKTMTLKIT